MQQRYADLDRQWVPVPHRPPPLADQIDRERRQVLRDIRRRRELAAREAAGEDVVAW